MADDEDQKPQGGHNLTDHLYGENVVHKHNESTDHDHDHFDFDDDGPLEQNPIWLQDHVTLVSVGIDIGSAGTQVIFSRINLRRYGEDLTSRYYVVSRETLYQSPNALTPYQSEERIDDAALGRIIDQAYAAAGLTPDQIDTGAVILTGEALRRENAQGIAKILSEQGGEFVCATAGHHMESMLAAYGSGASRVSHDEDKRILNIDIGGGTTKLAVVEKGHVVSTAAVHIGGRLQVVDEKGHIERLDPAGRYHARQAGFDWHKGDVINPEDLDKVAETMADELVAALVQRPMPHAVEHLCLTDKILDFGRIDGMMFSGGVGEYVYGRETRDFGDLGRRLGQAIRRRVDAGALPWAMLEAGECIRATALGASEYSVQLSGNTSFISKPGELLPRRNLQVLQPNFTCEDVIDPALLAKAIRSHFTSFDLIEGEGEVALALRWLGPPSYERIAAFAEGIRHGLANTIERRKPVYIMLDGDIAQTLGAILREELLVESEILAIDGVMLRDFDYIDLGRIRMPSYTVPVTIKSLVFSESPQGGRPAQRIHHHDSDGHRDHHHDHDHHHHHDGDHHHHGHGHDHPNRASHPTDVDQT
ncbi:MAG: ethanolamine utilization protein EutA [Alphaproteobacteria bacterium]|jgi:ethanolamine utilization protein EutA|nr:ethanolamine utilization protein EutA [Alphaproteobacteria bacterium]